MERKTCIVCGHRLPEQPLLRFDGMPASAQGIPDATEVSEDHGITLRLYQCQGCGLTQVDGEPVEYYRDVIRTGGSSTTMVEMRNRQYSHMIRRYHLEGKKFLEVGCGRGEFLKMLEAFPVEAYGVEHSPALAETARANGLRVFDGFTETADTVLGDAGPYDVFLSFNFLEHQPDPGVMLDCIRRNLTEDGMGLVTVPSLDDILQYDGYYELIRDHIAYYTFDTLRYLLELHGFEVLEEELVNRDTLAMIVRRKQPSENGGEAGKESDRAAVTPADFSVWDQSFARIRDQLLGWTEEIRRQGRTLAIWGASHQAFTLAATTCLGERTAYIIDSAPFKQGRFAPASHLPIVSPDDAQEHPADCFLIMAPGYTEEIFATIRRRFGEKTRVWTLRSDALKELT